MKSIRLSLIVYFLLLLGLALGAVSLVVYRITHQTLSAKKEATRQLLTAQYQDRCHEVETKLDDALYYQARSLASVAQAFTRWDRYRFGPLLALGMLNAAPTPNGHLLLPLWLAEYGFDRPLAFRAYHMLAHELQFSEEVLPRYHDGQVTEYFQVNSEMGSTWRSRTMDGHAFPFEPEDLTRTNLFDPKFDDYELAPGHVVRRVRVKAPITRIRNVRFEPLIPPFGPPMKIPPGNRRGVPEKTARSRRPERPVEANAGFFMSVMIHCACETSRRDEQLAELRAGLAQDLDDLEKESAATLASLRHRLLTVSLGTFAAAVLGGCWLVGLGLSPLRRLSDAVSRVSEKDFRLPFEEKRLASELSPIVERLTQTLEQLKRAFLREKQAAADISHELRTPLAALITTIEVALRKPRDPEQYREVLGECHASARQMCQLVERLLALARLDAQVDRLRPQLVDAAELAEECAALVRPLAESQNITLRVHRNGPVPLQADPAKLREVVTNLLHNAIQYNRPAGSVDLLVQRDNGQLVVEVRDTGIGIPAEARHQIFERFYRADPSRHSEGLHAGLGLAIVKGYVDLMGGSIAVESTVGQGSTFRVRLPALVGV